MNVYGFTLLRNGVKYDYPFRESLRSLSQVTSHIFLALGEGDDDTPDRLKDLNFLKIIPTRWDETLREGGVILSQQTNVALNALRAERRSEKRAWGFYLQCDEVLHEKDRDQILKDLEYASLHDYDAVAFRFIHFWQNHHQIAINKKWYPSEIRAIKLDSPIESWGDAQSFQGAQKIFYSDVPIYHYGHVRKKESYTLKKGDILKLYHQDAGLPKYRRREKRHDRQTQCLDYWGPHPLVMKERIESFGELWSLPEVDEVKLVTGEEVVSADFLRKINAKTVRTAKAPGSFQESFRDRTRLVFLNPNIWQKIFYPSQVPLGMKSRLARPWPQEFRLILKLSEKGIGFRP